MSDEEIQRYEGMLRRELERLTDRYRVPPKNRFASQAIRHWHCLESSESIGHSSS